MSDYTLAIKQ